MTVNDDRFFFSVIIPAFNRPDDLYRALKSLMSQKFKDFEVIILDDNSKVDLKKIVDEFSDSFQIKYKKFDENKGAAFARNAGVQMSEGRFVAFLDSDDEFCPEKLEVFKNEIVASNLSQQTLFFSSCYVNRGNGKLIVRPNIVYKPGADIMEYIFVHWGLVSTITIVLSRTLALSCPFNTSLRRHQEYDLCFTLQSSGVRFHMIDQPLSVWNDLPDESRITRNTGYDAAIVWFNLVKNSLSDDARNAYLARVLAPMVRPKTAGLTMLFSSFFKVKSFRVRDFPIFCIKVLMPNTYKSLSSLYVAMKGKVAD